MHWVIELTLIAGVIYLAYQVETARAQIAALARWADVREQQHREALGRIEEYADALAAQLNTPGTRHWTPPPEPDYDPYGA